MFEFVRDKIPEKFHKQINEKLQNATKDQEDAILSTDYRSPNIGIVISLMMFCIFYGGAGVDRFYKGDKLIGFLKLSLVTVLPIIFFVIGAILDSQAGTSSLSAYDGLETSENGIFAVVMILCGICFLVYLVWGFVDIFLVYFGIKKDNLKKIEKILNGELV